MKKAKYYFIEQVGFFLFGTPKWSWNTSRGRSARGCYKKWSTANALYIVYKNKKAAEKEAKKIGGIVVPSAYNEES